MAGKNQHYIPRMLLRGFSRPSQSGKEQQAYVYRHNQIFLDNINRIASENYFYSSQSDGTTPILDDKITAYESERIQSRFRVLQNANFDDRVDAEIATEIFTHFCIRQKFQQSIWSDTFSLIGYIVAYSALKSPEYVSKKAGIKKVFGVSYLSPKSDLWRSIIENAKQQNFLMFMLSYRTRPGHSQAAPGHQTPDHRFAKAVALRQSGSLNQPQETRRNITLAHSPMCPFYSDDVQIVLIGETGPSFLFAHYPTADNLPA